LEGWDMRRVISTSRMFYQARGFNQPLADWRLDAAVIMTDMFVGATAFRQSLHGWRHRRSTRREVMFDADFPPVLYPIEPGLVNLFDVDGSCVDVCNSC